jgi:serine/threonine-protein kinase
MALAQALLFGGRPNEAEAVVRDGLLLAPEDTSLLAAMGRIHVALGRVSEAEALDARMKGMRAARYVSPTDQAKLALALGWHDEAFGHVERCLAERRGWVVYMRVDPLWDPVRDDPRFRDVLRRVGLS